MVRFWPGTVCEGFVNIYLRFSSRSHPFHRLLRPQRPDQSIAYTACLHWFTLNDRKWRAGVAFVRGNSDLRRGRILLVLSIVSNIATRAASLGYIPQVSQSVHLCKLSARTHERTQAHSPSWCPSSLEAGRMACPPWPKGKKLVHLDLKGAPPRVEYLHKVMPWSLPVWPAPALVSVCMLHWLSTRVCFVSSADRAVLSAGSWWLAGGVRGHVSLWRGAEALAGHDTPSLQVEFSSKMPDKQY